VARERFQPRALSLLTVGSIAKARKKQIATVIIKSVRRDATYHRQMLNDTAKMTYQTPLMNQGGMRVMSTPQAYVQVRMKESPNCPPSRRLL